MSLNPTCRALFALLLVLLLPLRGLEATPACGHGRQIDSGAETATAWRTAPIHCAGGAILHHHDCGNYCCAAAIAPAPAPFIAPLLTPPEIPLTVIGSPPTVTLDRLDRPPRFIPA